MIVIYTVHYYDSASMSVCVHTSPMSTHAHTDIHAGRINTCKHMSTNQRRDISFDTE